MRRSQLSAPYELYVIKASQDHGVICFDHLVHTDTGPECGEDPEKDLLGDLGLEAAPGRWQVEIECNTDDDAIGDLEPGCSEAVEHPARQAH